MNPRDEKCPCCASTKIRIVDMGSKYECTSCLCVFVRANSESATVQVPRELWVEIVRISALQCPRGLAHPQSVWWEEHVKEPLCEAVTKAGL